jgi:hypothetical protein
VNFADILGIVGAQPVLLSLTKERSRAVLGDYTARFDSPGLYTPNDTLVFPLSKL